MEKKKEGGTKIEKKVEEVEFDPAEFRKLSRYSAQKLLQHKEKILKILRGEDR